MQQTDIDQTYTGKKKKIHKTTPKKQNPQIGIIEIHKPKTL